MGPDAKPFLDGPGPDASRAFEISAWSYASLARAVLPVMNEGGSIVGMDFDPRTAMPYYNWMGVAKAALEAIVRYLACDLGQDNIRVNAISAGPIKTLAASGVKGLRSMIGEVAEHAPLRRNVTQEDVGKAALFLCSDLGSGVTGEVVYVDAGYNIMGMWISPTA